MEFHENGLNYAMNLHGFHTGILNLKKASIPCAMSKKWKSRIASKKPWKFIGEFGHFQ